MERMIEVCAGSYQDCIAAYQGKAKRVELNSALSVGGLTPSVASLVRVKKETDLFIIYAIFLLWILRGPFDGWDPMEFYAFDSHSFIFFQCLPQVT